ncbi:MAG: DUF3795 domain-containing protein [Clostridia bacterium]|nr:DUF3795 domain-containing protein [Clostridia bacterium]
MGAAICGLDCSKCSLQAGCKGCESTEGHPFGGSCMLALCCKNKSCESCGNAFDSGCRLKKRLIAEFNALGIKDMDTVTDLNALHGSYINLKYTLPGGQSIRFWDDDRIYLGNQICKKGSERCYGLTADEHYLLVCEYGTNGTDAEIIIYKKWR